MKKITLTLALLTMITLSFTAQAGLIGKKAPVITTDLAVTDSLPALANKTITFTADFTNSGTTLDGTETLYAYFWAPWAFYWGGSASMVHVAGTLKWTVSFIPAVAFNHTQTEFLSNANNVCWYNIQTSTPGDDSGTLSLTFPKSKINPFLTTTTFADKGPKVTCTQNGITTGTYALDQPVTWTLDLTGTILGKDSLYIWAWDPTNPETLNGRTGTWNVPSVDNITKLKRVGAQTWNITLTPTTFYGKTVAQLQTSNPSGFWMKVRSSNGLIQTQAFLVQTNVTVTGINAPMSTRFTAYPNPVVDNLSISLNDNSFNQVSVYDFKGSMLSRVQVSSSQQQLNVSFSNFSKGVYLVVLNGNGKSESFKVTK